jgi:hypothetical protein
MPYVTQTNSRSRPAPRSSTRAAEAGLGLVPLLLWTTPGRGTRAVLYEPHVSMTGLIRHPICCTPIRKYLFHNFSHFGFPHKTIMSDRNSGEAYPITDIRAAYLSCPWRFPGLNVTSEQRIPVPSRGEHTKAGGDPVSSYLYSVLRDSD